MDHRCEEAFQIEFRWVSFALCTVLVIAGATQSYGQSQVQATAAHAPKYEYEVASIRPYKSDRNSAYLTPTPDGLTGANVSLRWLIQEAYGVRNYQISGPPDTIETQTYEIDAKMDGAVADAVQKLSRDDQESARQQMLQVLLADRFKLKVHRETKELPVFLLTVAKNGPKFKEATPGETYPNGFKGPDGRGGAGFVQTVGGRLGITTTAQAVQMPSLATMLSNSLERPVLDKTDLKGNYDFVVRWSAERLTAANDTGSGIASMPDSLAPPIFTAIQEQLGLKLVSGKGLVEIIVIDHVERPTPN